MRIGVNTLFLVPDDVGGTEIYLRNNLQHMVADNHKDTFIVFTTRDNDSSLRNDLARHPQVEFNQLPFRAAVRPIRILFEQTLLPWLVRKNKVEVLWSPGYTAPLLCSCPQVVTIHDLQYKTCPEDLSFLERITLDFLVKNACRKCDAIITVSQFSKSEMIRFRFAPKEKIFVVYEGVDPEFGVAVDINFDHIPITWTSPELSKKPYILCVAHTYPHKQVHLLIEAFGQLMEKIPHNLILVGKPRRGEDKVIKSLEDLPNTARIQRVNSLTEVQLRFLYQNADLFVLPSAYEGFGLPILEALLAGIPVITTPHASLPEVGGEQVTYIGKDTANTLAQAILATLTQDPSRKEEHTESGKLWATSFDWRNSAEKTLRAIYRSSS